MRVHLPHLRRLLPGMLGLALSAGAAGTLANPAQAVEPSGAKAAQVYCFMRSNGNNHEVSWAAAYGVCVTCDTADAPHRAPQLLG